MFCKKCEVLYKDRTFVLRAFTVQIKKSFTEEIQEIVKFVQVFQKKRDFFRLLHRIFPPPLI